MPYWGVHLITHCIIDDGVYQLYEKALHYAKLDKNIKYQATIMDAMSCILFFNNQWDKDLKIKRESIALMEIIDDKSEGLATRLGVLASYLIERGIFTEARTVVGRIDAIATELKSDHLSLIKSHYDVSIELLSYNYDYCQAELDKSMALATKTNNIAMLLNAVFLQMELLLARKDTLNFKVKYDKYISLFNQPGLDRYKIFLGLYWARYLKETGETEKSIALLGKVSELSKQSNDLKFLSDAQNILAQLYLEQNPEKSLDILQAIEQYNPNPNPYLENKAKALHALNRNVEATTLMLEAKIAYNEAWSAENQALLEELKN